MWRVSEAMLLGPSNRLPGYLSWKLEEDSLSSVSQVQESGMIIIGSVSSSLDDFDLVRRTEPNGLGGCQDRAISPS